MKQIKTEAEYQAALKEIESLMMADADKTPTEGEKLDVMVTLIEAYEAKHFPLLEEEEEEAKQDLTTMDELDRTIGKAIGAYPNFVTDKKQWKDTIDKFKDRKPQLSETLEYLKDK